VINIPSPVQARGYGKIPEKVREIVRCGEVSCLKRDDKGAERCTACVCVPLLVLAEAITMTAAKKSGEENLYREEKYASVYEINMLRCIFCACAKKRVRRKRYFLPTGSWKQIIQEIFYLRKR